MPKSYAVIQQHTFKDFAFVANITHHSCSQPCPGGQCSADVWVSTQTRQVHLQWPHESRGWLRHGRTRAGFCTAGNTECGPSRGAR